jgi:hypothetical protein
MLAGLVQPRGNLDSDHYTAPFWQGRPYLGFGMNKKRLVYGMTNVAAHGSRAHSCISSNKFHSRVLWAGRTLAAFAALVGSLLLIS